VRWEAVSWGRGRGSGRDSGRKRMINRKGGGAAPLKKMGLGLGFSFFVFFLCFKIAPSFV
jgi:hypothetical protein